MKYSLKERFLITFRWQFRLKVLSNIIVTIKDNLKESLYNLFCGLVGLVGSLTVSPVMLIWEFTFGYLYNTLKAKDSELTSLKEKITKNN